MTIAEKLLRAKTDIDEVHAVGYVEGSKLVDRTLYGVYILKDNVDMTTLADKYVFEENFTDKGVYAHFYDGGNYFYQPISKMYWNGIEYCPIGFYNTYNAEDGEYLLIMYSIDDNKWYWEIGGYNGGDLPDSQGRIIVFTKPIVVSQDVYNAFKDITDNGTSEFITSDATARANNIHNGKTAYVGGKKITGTAKTYDEGYNQCTEDMQDDLRTKYTDGYNTGYNAGYSKAYEESTSDVYPFGRFLNFRDGLNLFYKCTFTYEELAQMDGLSSKKFTTCDRMFDACNAITTIPQIDVSNSTNFMSMFRNCTALTTVPPLDARECLYFTSMFSGCKVLTNLVLKNIKASIQVASGTSYGHLLTVDSLVNLIYELRNTGSSKTLTVGNANITKLANVYVKTIDITDEMRAEDDLIDEKLPFEICESTDEGSCLIADYVNLKNWKLS